ncbi:MAG: pilus assembly protein PilX [Parasporobacterium sp.]|nr:pilus assembly protein PilX [Parasporobacterium sp.]
MRKINAILGPAMILLLLIHVITGVFQLTSVIPGGSMIRKVLAIILTVLVGIHMVIGILLTVQTLTACRKTGVSYFKNNELFWLRRISGFAMLFLIIAHILIFSGESGEAFRLHSFGSLPLILSLLLVLALAIHLITNIRPLFIALGIENRVFLKDIMVILSILLLVSAAAFLFYYLRWNVLWSYSR